MTLCHSDAKKIINYWTYRFIFLTEYCGMLPTLSPQLMIQIQSSMDHSQLMQMNWPPSPHKQRLWRLLSWSLSITSKQHIRSTCSSIRTVERWLYEWRQLWSAKLLAIYCGHMGYGVSRWCHRPTSFFNTAVYPCLGLLDSTLEVSIIISIIRWDIWWALPYWRTIKNRWRHVTFWHH